MIHSWSPNSSRTVWNRATKWVFQPLTSLRCMFGTCKTMPTARDLWVFPECTSAAVGQGCHSCHLVPRPCPAGSKDLFLPQGLKGQSGGQGGSLGHSQRADTRLCVCHAQWPGAYLLVPPLSADFSAQGLLRQAAHALPAGVYKRHMQSRNERRTYSSELSWAFVLTLTR